MNRWRLRIVRVLKFVNPFTRRIAELQELEDGLKEMLEERPSLVEEGKYWPTEEMLKEKE